MEADLSHQAFVQEYELRYDTMPAWWWNQRERNEAYEAWKASKKTGA